MLGKDGRRYLPRLKAYSRGKLLGGWGMSICQGRQQDSNPSRWGRSFASPIKGIVGMLIGILGRESIVGVLRLKVYPL